MLERRMLRPVKNAEKISEVLAQQDGVIARAQALRWGMTEAQVRHQLTSGRWIQLHPGVYRSAEHRLSTQSRVRAVGFWGGEMHSCQRPGPFRVAGRPQIFPK